MLSTDENPPVDLSCSSSSSQLIKGCSNIGNDEKDCDENDQKLKLKLDLFKSSSALDENKEPVSNFSIRDYVFSTRDKDIKTHWPFSPKNLQLCLKHGVSDVLPPFQTPHSVKNTSTLDSKAQESPSSNKVVRNTRVNPVKNCKLAVKLPGNTNSELPKSSKDQSMKTTMVTDHTMASKVCPVCKTFSSSSNTTLNAHIDQCLSEGPMSNLTNSKVIIKHRIKPRKIRLMVDIYSTALPCTLEDLDRRNGTNWASNSNPAKDLKDSPSIPPTDNEEKNENFKDFEGAVYVDSTGKKLRILSKFCDIPSIANVVDDSSLRKVVKCDKGYKFLSSKKKKHFLQNHKIVKSSTHEKILDHSPKTKNYEPKDVSSKEGVKKHDQRQPLELRDRMISNDFRIVKKWVGSKRTLSKKKNILEHERHLMDKTIMKNLTTRNRLLSAQNFHELAKGTNDSSSPPLSEKITSLSAESRKRKENSSLYSHDEHTEQRCLGKRTESRNLGKKSHLSHSKSKDSQKDGTTHPDRCKEIPHGSRDCVSSRGDKHIRAQVSPAVTHDGCSRRSRMSQNQAFSNGSENFLPQKNLYSDRKILASDKKFSSSKKNLPSSIKHASVSESIKHVEVKKRRLCYSSESDEEPIVPQPTICRRIDEMVETLDEDVSQREQLFNKPSKDRFKESKVQKSCLKNSIGSISHCIGKNTDDSYLGNDVKTATSNTQDAINEVEGTDIMAFDKYLDSELPSYAEYVPRHFVKAADEVLGCEQETETFPMTNRDHLVIPNNAGAVIEIDANEDQQTYSAAIDPITIPGPPGSFLPSPGRMGSDEVQGSSSLTTCRMIHSSEDDDHERVDMDSSDSPSATSIVSKSIVDGSDLLIIDPSKHQSSVQGKTHLPDASIHRTAEFSRNKQHNESRANTISSEWSSRGLIRNSEPCCCSRKEGALRSDFLYYQESPQVLRQQTMNSNQMDGNLMYKFNSFNSRSEVLNMKDHPTSQPDRATTNSSIVSQNHYETPSPTTPNPVLRLMGKNLMVVNKEENFSPKIRPTQDVVDEHLGSRSFSDNGRPDKDMQNMQYSYNAISNQVNRQSTINAVEFSPPNGFRMHSGGFRKPELFPQNSFNGICTPSFEYREYEGGFGPIRDHLTSNISMNASNIGHDEKIETHHLEVNPMPLSIIDALKNLFHVYKTHDGPLRNATLMVQNAYARAPYSMEMHENPEKWNITAENPRILRTNSFAASSSLPGVPRSSSQYISAMKAFPERRF